jgi:hypothetical protein
VSAHGGQAGSTWDLYQVRAPEAYDKCAGSIGSRLANRTDMGLCAGKQSTQGPTLEMLQTYYKQIIFLSGDQNYGVLGPFTNRSQNDCGMLEQWMESGDVNTPNRGFWAMGDGLAEALSNGGLPQIAFLTSYLGVSPRSGSYAQLSGNTQGLVTVSPAPGSPIPSSEVYRARNACPATMGNDVLEPNLAIPEVTPLFQYEDYGGWGPYISSIWKPWAWERPWFSVVDGTNPANLMSFHDGDYYGRASCLNAIWMYALQLLNACAAIPAAPQCDAPPEWKVGPAIQLDALGCWPAGDTLVRMRPGDVIAIRASAHDDDYLIQKCIDPDTKIHTFKVGTYRDCVAYDWSLVGGGPGRLIQPAAGDKNTVLYQIPFGGWRSDRGAWLDQEATVCLTVKNSGKGAKAPDADRVGAKVIIHMRSGAPKEWVGVLIAIETGGSAADEPFVPVTDGDCVREAEVPEWEPTTGIAAADIACIMRDLGANRELPDYLALLSVDASDVDAVNLKCKPTVKKCAIGRTTTDTGDALLYQWSIVNGKGSFPLYSDGPVVAFRRSRSGSATVKCRIFNYSGQVSDAAVEKTVVVPSAPKPRALVALGNIENPAEWRVSEKMGTAYDAAGIAKTRYEQAGYDVDYRAAARLQDVLTVLADRSYQALWMCGHGGPGWIAMNPPPTYATDVTPDNIMAVAMGRWRSERHPMLREIAALGCASYSPEWRECGYGTVVLDCTYEPMNTELIGKVNRLNWKSMSFFELEAHEPIQAYDLSEP